MKYFRHHLAVAAWCLVLSGSMAAPLELMAAAQSQPVAERVKALHVLLDEQWEYTLRTGPEFASILGDKRYNDKLSDFSQAAIERDQEQTRLFLRKFEAVDTTGFPEQEKL